VSKPNMVEPPTEVASGDKRVVRAGPILDKNLGNPDNINQGVPMNDTRTQAELAEVAQPTMRMDPKTGKVFTTEPLPQPVEVVEREVLVLDAPARDPETGDLLPGVHRTNTQIKQPDGKMKTFPGLRKDN